MGVKEGPFCRVWIGPTVVSDFAEQITWHRAGGTPPLAKSLHVNHLTLFYHQSRVGFYRLSATHIEELPAPKPFCLGHRFALCQIEISVSAADDINHFTGRTSDHDTKGLRDGRKVTLWLTPFWPIMSASKSASKQACLQECRLAQRAASS